MTVRRRGMPEMKLCGAVRIEKPDCLNSFAAEHWDCVVPKLAEMGVLHPIDSEALTALCQWWGEYRTLQESSADGSGEAYKRSIALASCFKNWSNLASRFGLTPADRAKLVVAVRSENDPAAEFVR